MSEFKVIFLLAFTVEAVWQGLKYAWPKKLREFEESHGVPVDAIGCIVLALLLCLGTGADLLSLIGVPLAIPYVGSILTAFIIYRGSNFTHDIIAGLNDLRNSNKAVSWSENEMGLAEEPDVDIGYDEVE